MSAAEETKPVEAVAAEAPAQAAEPVEVNEPAKAEEPAKKEETEAKPEEAEVKPEETAAKPEEKKEDVLKTTAQIDSKDHANNVKFDASVLQETDDPVEIRKQVHEKVEFYLSDSNLPHDKYLWELTGGFENNAIPLKTITSFKRMRRFQPYSAVVAALKESASLEISGEEGEELIKRKQAYTPSNDKYNLRCVYVKGFGDEEPSTQFDLEAFFTQFGPINSVRLRRTAEKLFKGSVFVEFPDEEAAQKFLALDPKPKWKGHDLKIMPKVDYVKEKSALIIAGKLEPNQSRRFFEGKDGSDRGRGKNNNRGGRDKDNWKQRRDNDQKNGFRGGRGGRGGRGRGRGGDRRGGRDQQENRRDPNERANDRNAGKPTIQATNDKGEVVSEDKNNNGKRAREDDGAAAQPEAKKVDTKAEVAA
ncbi:La domain-containing protein [Colletotrichum karsti]|uniref:La domain-containing protein n=1 Tax=Colletotrichum karsti TaxID=1095194 RepID=A0A9P6LIN0_9PEZI|nr:La domain-containing protein [Colletotrichum karsti]KAF9874798.1 La domain-containing protein [Colletotrichum karsti]